jgi:hypothetical protein
MEYRRSHCVRDFVLTVRRPDHLRSGLDPVKSRRSRNERWQELTSLPRLAFFILQQIPQPILQRVFPGSLAGARQPVLETAQPQGVAYCG